MDQEESERRVSSTLVHCRTYHMGRKWEATAAPRVASSSPVLISWALGWALTLSDVCSSPISSTLPEQILLLPSSQGSLEGDRKFF